MPTRSQINTIEARGVTEFLKFKNSFTKILQSIFVFFVFGKFVSAILITIPKVM